MLPEGRIYYWKSSRRFDPFTDLIFDIPMTLSCSLRSSWIRRVESSGGACQYFFGILWLHHRGMKFGRFGPLGSHNFIPILAWLYRHPYGGTIEFKKAHSSFQKKQNHLHSRLYNHLNSHLDSHLNSLLDSHFDNHLNSHLSAVSTIGLTNRERKRMTE